MTQPPKLRLRFETVGSIAAILVGIAAIMVSWDQGRVMRAQQHASVLPAIQIDGYVNENAGRLTAGLRLRNNGVGPALIHDFTLALGDETVTGWDEFTALAPSGSGRNWSSVTGRVLGQGEEITAIELFWEEASTEDLSALRNFVVGLTSAIDVSACYCSVFDRCFISRLGSDGALLPEPVRTCPETSDWTNQVELVDPTAAETE
ncbi:MAG: hypothetical protein AAFX09_06225 [Pseudomonadota bacterium]